jgi:hypothetical protein
MNIGDKVILINSEYMQAMKITPGTIGIIKDKDVEDITYYFVDFKMQSNKSKHIACCDDTDIVPAEVKV